VKPKETCVMAHKTVRSASFHSPTIRGAYFYLHEKRTKGGDGQPIAPESQKYEFIGLIPKLDKDATKCANYLLFANAAMTLVPMVPEWHGQYPAGGNWPIKDGDLKAAKYPWMAGHWTINFSGNYPPKVAVLQNGQVTEIPARRIGTQDAYKSGDYCIVSTYAFSYDNKSRGIKFDMEGVLFVAAGEAIGTAQRSVAQIFDGVNATAPAGLPMPVPSAQPGPPAMPVAGAPQQYAPPAALPVTAAPPSAPQYAPPPMPPTAAPVMPSAAGLPPFPGR
jgi:hypothetical protein